MSDAYMYNVADFNGGDLSPEAPNDASVGGDVGLNFNSGGDVTPPAPVINDGFTGMPDSSGDTMPKPPIVDGKTMPMNMGKTTGAL